MGFEQRLIAEVRKYPNLYDPNDSDYKDMAKACAHWKNIAIELDRADEVSYIKGKWRSLRDGYARARRKRFASRMSSKKLPHYKFYKELNFLAAFIKHKEYDDSFPVNAFLSQENDIDEEEDFSSQGGILVPDVILKEEIYDDGCLEEDYDSVQDVGSLSSMTNSLLENSRYQDITCNGVSGPSKLQEEHAENRIRDATLEANRLQMMFQTFDSSHLQDILKNLLQEKQKLDEDEAFSTYVAISLKKFSKRRRSEAKLKIQEILHQYELKQLEDDERR